LIVTDNAPRHIYYNMMHCVTVVNPCAQFSQQLFFPIKCTVLNRFGGVVSRDPIGRFQVSDGSGNFYDPVICPYRQANLIDGCFKQPIRGAIDSAMLFNLAVAHLGVAKYF